MEGREFHVSDEPNNKKQTQRKDKEKISYFYNLVCSWLRGGSLDNIVSRGKEILSAILSHERFDITPQSIARR